MMPEFRTILRWLAVLPAAILASFFIMFPVHWILITTFSSRGIDGLGINLDYEHIRIIEGFFQGIFPIMAFVYFGSQTAPSHRKVVSIVLALFVPALLISMILLQPEILNKFIKDGFLTYGDFVPLVTNITGITVAVWLVFRKENEDSLGEDRGDTLKDKLGNLLYQYQTWSSNRKREKLLKKLYENEKKLEDALNNQGSQWKK